MMQQTDEQQLLELTLKLIRQYESLDELISGLESSDLSASEALDPFRALMGDIQSTEEVLQPLRDHARESGSRFPARLAQPTDKLVQMLKELLPRISNIEQKGNDKNVINCCSHESARTE